MYHSPLSLSRNLLAISAIMPVIWESLLELYCLVGGVVINDEDFSVYLRDFTEVYTCKI